MVEAATVATLRSLPSWEVGPSSQSLWRWTPTALVLGAFPPLLHELTKCYLNVLCHLREPAYCPLLPVSRWHIAHYAGENLLVDEHLQVTHHLIYLMVALSS
jgi:hypothetical protein